MPTDVESQDSKENSGGAILCSGKKAKASRRRTTSMNIPKDGTR
jgi:hypothetical protein